MVSRPVPILTNWQEFFSSSSSSPTLVQWTNLSSSILSNVASSNGYANKFRISQSSKWRTGKSFLFVLWSKHMHVSKRTTNTSCPFKHRRRKLRRTQHMILLRRSIVDARVCINNVNSIRTKTKTHPSVSYTCPSPKLHIFFHQTTIAPFLWSILSRTITFHKATSAWIETKTTWWK